MRIVGVRVGSVYVFVVVDRGIVGVVFPVQLVFASLMI